MATLVATVVTFLLTYFSTRRKNKAEIDKIVINNIADIINIYKVAMDDLQKEMAGLKAEVHNLTIKLTHYQRFSE